MSDDVRHEPDQPETDAEHKNPENEALEAEVISAAAASDTFEQAGGAGSELATHDRAERETDEEVAELTLPKPAKLERLQKILARAGIASRRHAEELITGGRVQVNGQVVTELGSKADPTHDHIRVDGKLLQGSERHRYFMLNKPKGFVTTVSDPEGRPTIMQFFSKMRERLYPVGRLDYLSEGLLLVTNDGELANKLTRAASSVEKTYLVKVSGRPSEEDLERLRQGVAVDRGKPGAGRVQTAPAEIRPFRPGKSSKERQAGRSRTGDNPWFEVVLIEGRNRELRKMFEEIGHHVEKIRRVGYGPLVLDLEPGKFRELEPEEVENLRKAAEGKYHKPKSREPRQRTASPGTERRPEKPQWKQRQSEGRDDRGKFRRGAGQGFGADRNRAPKRGQFGSRNRFSDNRFSEKREDRPPRRDRGDRPFGESRERRGRFAEEPPRADAGKFKRFGPGRSQPSFADSREVRGGQPERQPFGRGERKPFGRPKPFRRDREDQPRFERPRRENENRPRIEEGRGPQTRFRRDLEATPRFERPRREESESKPGEERRERRGQPPSGRPAGRSSAPRGGFRGGKPRGSGKSGSVRSGGGRRPGSKTEGKPRPGKRRP